MEVTIPDSPVFVFRKETDLKFLSAESVRTGQKQLQEDGYVHVATIDPCVFLGVMWGKIESSMLGAWDKMGEDIGDYSRVLNEEDVEFGKYFAYESLSFMFEFNNSANG